MPDEYLTKDDLIPAIVEKLQKGDAQGLGFDALLKERITLEWNDVRKEVIDAVIQTRVQEAMKGYLNRVFQIAGLLGIILLATLATRLYNFTQTADIAAQIREQEKSDQKSEIKQALIELRREIGFQTAEIKREAAKAISASQEAATKAVRLDESMGHVNGGELRKKKLEEAFSALITQIGKIEADIALKTNALSNISSKEALLDGKMTAKLQDKFSLTKDDIERDLANTVPLSFFQLRAVACDAGFQEITTLQLYDKDDAQKIRPISAVVCAGDKLITND